MNSGTIRKTVATGTTTIGTSAVDLNNTGGTLDIQTGALTLTGAFNTSGAGSLSAGTVNVTNGGTGSAAP